MVKLRIKEYLKEADITQTELSELLGITPSTLSKRISGTTITLQQLDEIADALHVSVSLLIDEEGNGLGEFLCPKCGYPVKVTIVAK